MTEVRVLDETGKLISTTTRCGHIRKLLKTNQAKVVNKTPFTVQLLYKTDTVGKSIDRKDNNIMDTFSVFSPVNSESRDGYSSILSENLTHCIIAGDKNTCKFDIVNKIIDGLDKDTNTLTVILDPNNRWKSEDLEKTESVKNTVLNLLVPYVEMAVEDHAEIFAEVFCETYHLDSDDKNELYETIMEAYEFDYELNMATIYDIITDVHPERAIDHPCLANALSVFKDANSHEQNALFSHQGIDLGHFLLDEAGHVICNEPEDEKHHSVIVFNSESLSGNTTQLYISLLLVYISKLIAIMKKDSDKFKVFIVVDDAERYFPPNHYAELDSTFSIGPVKGTHFIAITNGIDKLPSYVVANSNQIIFTHTDPSITHNESGTAIHKILQYPEDVEALSELSDEEYMIIKPHEYYGTVTSSPT